MQAPAKPWRPAPTPPIRVIGSTLAVERTQIGAGLRGPFCRFRPRAAKFCRTVVAAPCSPSARRSPTSRAKGRHATSAHLPSRRSSAGSSRPASKPAPCSARWTRAAAFAGASACNRSAPSSDAAPHRDGRLEGGSRLSGAVRSGSPGAAPEGAADAGGVGIPDCPREAVYRPPRGRFRRGSPRRGGGFGRFGPESDAAGLPAGPSWPHSAVPRRRQQAASGQGDGRGRQPKRPAPALYYFVFGLGSGSVRYCATVYGAGFPRLRPLSRARSSAASASVGSRRYPRGTAPPGALTSLEAGCCSAHSHDTSPDDE